jgi:transcriptional regulator with XRE-family HTH domain
MPGPRPNPTASRRALAGRLRRMRLAAGKSADDAARELMVSASKISRLESGERMPQPRDVRDLARYYGATGEEMDQLQSLLTEARRRGWWEDFSTPDEASENFYGLETAARTVDLFEALRWPGVLQTPELTRAMVPRLRLGGELSEEFVEEQVTIRRKRQERLLSGEMTFHAILDEVMFLRPMGEGLVTRQVQRMIDLARELPNVTIQVVPLTARSYPGLDGSFQIMRDFEHNSISTTVFVEGLLGHRLVEQAILVGRYQGIFESIAENDALDPEDTLRWLEGFLVRAP